jgi:hypothetical protein
MGPFANRMHALLTDGLTKGLPIERFNKLNMLSGMLNAPKEKGESKIPSGAFDRVGKVSVE